MRPLLANDPSFGATETTSPSPGLPEVQTAYPFPDPRSGIEAKPTSDGGGLIPTTDAGGASSAESSSTAGTTNPKRSDEIVIDQRPPAEIPHLDIGKTMTISQHVSPQELASLPASNT